MAPPTSADRVLRIVPPASRTSRSTRRAACSLSLAATAWRTAARRSGLRPDQRPSSKAARAAAGPGHGGVGLAGGGVDGLEGLAAGRVHRLAVDEQLVVGGHVRLPGSSG